MSNQELYNNSSNKARIHQVSERAHIAIPYAYVGHAFYNATIDQKKKYLDILYDYYKADYEDTAYIVLYDGYGEKEIGQYPPFTSYTQPR